MRQHIRVAGNRSAINDENGPEIKVGVKGPAK